MPPRHLRAGAAQGRRTCCCRRSSTPRAGRGASGGRSPSRCVAPRIRARSRRCRSCSRGTGSTAPPSPRRGSGLSKQPAIAVPPLLEVLASATPRPRCGCEAVRGLGRLGDPRAVAPLVALLDEATLDPALQVEVVTALGALKAQPAIDGCSIGCAIPRRPCAPPRSPRSLAIEGREVPAGAVGRRSRSRLDGARRGRDRARHARRRRARSGVEAVSRRHRPAHLAGDDEGARRREDAAKPRQRWIACCGRD